VLPDYTLLFVQSVLDAFEITGDPSLVKELWPACLRAIQAFDPYRKKGLLVDVPHWIFIDWADVHRKPISVALNLFYVGALFSAAQLAEILGDEKSERTCHSLAAQTCEAIRERYFDERAQLLRDGNDRHVSRPYSQHAQILGALYGVLSTGEAGLALRFTLEPRPDVTQIGSPYFAFYLLEALEKAGLHEKALKYIDERFGAMLDFGATTFFEQWTPCYSHCHGWSSAPSYFLITHVLGLSPSAPGSERFRLSPNIGRFDWVEAEVPVGREEDLFVRVAKGAQGIEIDVKVPQGISIAIVSKKGSPPEVELVGPCARKVNVRPTR
jgi:hypothetical protein